MTPLRFCMVTTFYPPYHFGGDAMYIYRLSHALARRGHSVDVLHDRDAFYLARRGEPSQRFADHPGVRVVAMKSPAGALSPLLTQQTARPFLKPEVRERLTAGGYDVIHFHNMSLIGSTALGLGRGVKLYTTHEHWLICPMHVLWKFDREPCDAPQCLACSIRGRRPPQLWRYTRRLERDLAHVNRLLSPSRFTMQRHVDAGVTRPISVLPYFVPAPPPLASAIGGEPVSPKLASASEGGRPYFLYVGRLVKLKGVDTLIDAFRRYPDADLIIVGDGEERAALARRAEGMPNVTFAGAQDQARLATLYRHAVALIMPSVGYEVFGIVLIEAFAQKTPVIVRQRGGMPEAVEDSGGGLTFASEDELLAAMRRLQQSPALRDELGEKGYRGYLERWSETPHLERYLSIVEAERRSA
jgi:glycosyltransferase involved in cell wall biosynthesis